MKSVRPSPRVNRLRGKFVDGILVCGKDRRLRLSGCPQRKRQPDLQRCDSKCSGTWTVERYPVTGVIARPGRANIGTKRVLQGD